MRNKIKGVTRTYYEKKILFSYVGMEVYFSIAVNKSKCVNACVSACESK